MPVWLPSALKGLAFGIVVAAFNHFLVVRAEKMAESLPPQKGKNLILMRFGIRYMLNVLALFLVYKDAPMLIGTALGLTVNKNFLFFKYLFKKPERKG
ncbi:MAG: hypothetical protein ACYDEQ_06485 [Desulfocucumaceae bacterium]